jgi:hypothetical protein
MFGQTFASTADWESHRISGIPGCEDGEDLLSCHLISR